MLHTFDARMRRAVQQESRNVQSSLTKGGNVQVMGSGTGSGSAAAYGVMHGRASLLVLLFIPLALVSILLLVLGEYNSSMAFDREVSGLLQSAEEEAAARATHSDLVVFQKKEQDASMTREVLVLTTKQGQIRVVLRPDLSAGSVDYIHRLVATKVCGRCNFYRAEIPGILQGIMKNKDVPVNDVKGPCRADAESVQNDCPKWDSHCGCHGPIMTRGAVGWAAGQAGGPDFFIDNYKVR